MEKEVHAIRRVFLVTAAACLATGLTAGPALASHTHQRFHSEAAFAVWQTKTPISSTEFKVTTWFVGLFPSNHGTFSDVEREVAKCTKVNGHLRCRGVSFAFGFRRLSASQFTFDSRHLNSASVDATYQLRQFKPRRTFRVKIVANWAGTGKISRSHGTDNFHSGCLSFHASFKDRQRAAVATGSVNAKSLGSTKRASLSTDTSLVIRHTC
jgi:hypothetical protein